MRMNLSSSNSKTPDCNQLLLQTLSSDDDELTTSMEDDPIRDYLIGKLETIRKRVEEMRNIEVKVRGDDETKCHMDGVKVEEEAGAKVVILKLWKRTANGRYVIGIRLANKTRQIMKIKDVTLNRPITYEQIIFDWRRRTTGNNLSNINEELIVYLVFNRTDVVDDCELTALLTYEDDFDERQLHVGEFTLKRTDFYDDDCRLRTIDILKRIRLNVDNQEDRMDVEMDLENSSDDVICLEEDVLALISTHFSSEILITSNDIDEKEIVEDVVKSCNLKRVAATSSYYMLMDASDSLDNSLVQFLFAEDAHHRHTKETEGKVKGQVTLRIYTRDSLEAATEDLRNYLHEKLLPNRLVLTKPSTSTKSGVKLGANLIERMRLIDDFNADTIKYEKKPELLRTIYVKFRHDIARLEYELDESKVHEIDTSAR